MNRYPTGTELRIIRKWKLEKQKDYYELMNYIKPIWNYSDIEYWKQRGRTFWISTGGWSGNEDIVTTLRENKMFWIMTWVQSRIGGHFIFKMPKIAR